MKLFKKIKWKKALIVTVILAIIGITVRSALNRTKEVLMQNFAAHSASTTAKVERRDIETVLSSSGTIDPLNTYEVTTLVEGEVIAADFEEGDYVEKGQVLYQIASDDLDSKIETAKTSVSRAERNYSKAMKRYDKMVANYEDALADYNKAFEDFGDANLLAEETGIIKSLYVKAGDKIQNGSQIAEVYDNSTMILEVPFNASQVNDSLIGKQAEVIMVDSFETLTGKVTKVSSIDEVLAGNRLVNMVTIEVKNPGGLTIESIATAKIGDIYSSSEGKFDVKTEVILTSDRAGEIHSLHIQEGSKIKVGDILLTFEKESVEDQLDSYQMQLDNAEDAMENAKDNVETADEAIEDAKKSLEDILETKEDFSITAPISGQIISKIALEGDTIASRSILCTIYDLSAVVFEMYVDELDVLSVNTGQEVTVTADAFEETAFQGVVTNVSLQSTASGGVTQYPVTVRVNEPGDLLPGMNVTGEIIIERKENVIAVPSEALMRGDVVYVVDPTVTEAVGDVPAGYKEVAVETGITDGDYIEIKSGLTGNEEVYVIRNTGAGEIMIDFMPGTMPANNAEFHNNQRYGGRTNANVEIRPNNRR